MNTQPEEPETEDIFVQPHSREAEEAAVGCVLINPALFVTLSEIVGSKDFYILRLGFIWQAFGALIERGADIDIVTVAEELDRAGKLEDIGGRAFLTALLNQVPTTLHAETYAADVKNYAGKRAFLAMANKVAEFSANGKTVAQIAAFAEGEIGRISIANNVETNTILSSADAVKLAMDATQAATNGNTNVVPTGLIDLDKLLHGGMREGRLVLIAGRPGDGKSALLLTIANNAAIKHKKRVGIFSMEMPTEEQVNRLLAQLSGIDFNQVESGKMAEENWPAYYWAVEQAESAGIYWDDTPSLTIPQLRMKARKMADQGLDLIVLDSLNLLNPQMPNAKPYEKVNAMGYQLKILARELRVPLLAAHQMNRGIEQRSGDPQLSDLEQAGEQPSDIIGFIYQNKDDPTMANTRNLKIAKHRGGPLGVVNLIFRSGQTKFEDAVSRKIDLSAMRDPTYNRKDIDA